LTIRVGKKGKQRKMNKIVTWYSAASAKMQCGTHGQTMTEYALILAAVAIVAYITYQVMGQDIGSMVSTIDNALAAA
jgi:Flp pilus assembly pilin Flp